MLRRLLSKRNRAIADSYATNLEKPVWSDMTLEKAVKEGYKLNGWVYRCVRLISSSGSSVPWGVFQDGEIVEDHPVTKVLEKPNPHISRQTVFELLISWLELCGNAYLIPVKVRGQTTELWPCSPDRIRPVSTNDPVSWIKGFAGPTDERILYQPEEVCHFLFPDPSNPIVGIGPLQAASKAVDTDSEQKDWNKAAMQNRGVLDGIFTFKREFKRIEDLEDLTNRLNEKFSGKTGKRIGAVGNEATYTRIAANPTEMDFNGSRKMNRDEIFSIFGVPGPLAGATENLTYNNYASSELIFWMSTIVPLLDDMKDTLNFQFRDEMGAGLEIGYDLSNVPAIRKARLDQTKSAKLLSEMGVPVENINKLFKLGISEYEGWDESYRKAVKNETEPEARMERRSIFDRKETDAKRYMTEVEDVFRMQKSEVEDVLKNGGDPRVAVEKYGPEMKRAIEKMYTEIAPRYIDVEIRNDEVATAIREYLAEEAIILKEASLIEATTVAQIIEQVEDSISQGLPVAAASQAIDDMGTFSAARALRIARTVAGTAASVGQVVSAKKSGATNKTWVVSGAEVRDAHLARAGETVGMEERFSAQIGSIGPRFPGDPEVNVADRVNCRCALTFS